MSDKSDLGILPIKVNATADLNPIVNESSKIINSIVTKPIGAVSDTLIALWSLTAGNIDFLNSLVQAKKEAYLDLQHQTFDKASTIDEANIQDPSIAIVGPAIEASKYYFENEYYRELFSNLISRSMDKTYNKNIHPSFTEIIKQLSIYDAEFLLSLNKLGESETPLSKFMYEDESCIGKLGSSRFDASTIWHDTFLTDDNELTELIIDNLVRLGLCTITFDKKFNKENMYFDLHDRMMREIQEDIHPEYVIRNNIKHIRQFRDGLFILTQFGVNFMNVCVVTNR